MEECIEVVRDAANAPNAACLVKPRLFDAWLVETKDKAREALLALPSAQQVEAGVVPSFRILQYLASSLRTLMAADLNSRDAPVLPPARSFECRR